MRYTDQQIVAGLLAGGRGEHSLLKQLYQVHQSTVFRFVQEQQGSKAEAKDIFQEGILVLYKQVRAGKFRGESSLGTYLFSICKYLWFQKLKKESRRADLLERQPLPFTAQDIDPYRKMEDKEQRDLMLTLFQQIGEQCRKVLLFALYDEISMDEIAQKMGFKSGQIARNKKYKCLKRLKKVMNEQPEAQALVRELR